MLTNTYLQDHSIFFFKEAEQALFLLPDCVYLLIDCWVFIAAHRLSLVGVSGLPVALVSLVAEVGL